MVDLLREHRPACTLWPVMITGGSTESYADGFYRAPKRELLVGLQVMLQSGELRIAADVPESEALVRELSAMRVEVTETGKEGWRSGARSGSGVVVGRWRAALALGRPGGRREAYPTKTAGREARPALLKGAWIGERVGPLACAHFVPVIGEAARAIVADHVGLRADRDRE